MKAAHCATMSRRRLKRPMCRQNVLDIAILRVLKPSLLGSARTTEGVTLKDSNKTGTLCIHFYCSLHV